MRLQELKEDKYVEHLIRDISDNADWLQFFLIFARFEYALKQSGFNTSIQPRPQKSISPWYISRHTGNTNSSYIVASWAKFAKAIERNFYHNTPDEVISAIRYISEHPPHVQYKNERKEIDWRPFFTTRENEIAGIIEAIKTVRNNLFHGAKYPTIPNPDPSRDIELTKHCITILKYMLTLNRDVKEYYYQALG